nr:MULTISPECIES: molybdopterin-dependent oxidoreductase [unclassified Ruegeria]
MTGNHWGTGISETKGGKLIAVHPHPNDPNPSDINRNIASSLNGRARVLRPAVRRGWLEGEGTRGRDSFVEVSWDDALDLIASELTRVRESYGNEAIFGGSYGWSSAGRFHHAQSQLKRFLNTQGGFVRSEGNYSYNAALVLMPHIVGPFRTHVAQATRWPVVAEHSDLVVMFGGMATRNTQVSDGGVARHRMMDNLKACAAKGVKFVNFSPLKRDAADEIGAEWLPPKPGTDTAVMMGLAHTLLTEGLHDRGFLDRYTVGFDKFAAYLRGEDDGIKKSAGWAASISGISAERISSLAREMAAGRTMVACAAALQRADYGEQPLWMTVTLAAMLGQIGLPGGGYIVGYGVNANIGNIERPFRWGGLPQGKNSVSDFIPVAMISEMLLNPGGAYKYNGEDRVFPDIRMIWWAGGNPFHHHQDLRRLHDAFQRPETIIVNELNWTATARHADIVLPVAAPQERTDIGGGKSDNALVPMPASTKPRGDARIEFDIYTELSRRLGNADQFTEGLGQDGWLRRIWAQTQEAALRSGEHLPAWEAFIQGDVVEVRDPSPAQVFLADFRQDPDANPLPTPSGRIEIYSDRISGFQLGDCHGHPTWLEPRDTVAATHSLYLLSGQPGTRLHSQLDNGEYSLSLKVQGREPVLIHPDDAADRGISDGDVVELFNGRGRCLAGARVTPDIMKGCVFLWTGAWYDPDYNAPQQRDRHGNPNTLTHDLRTSSLTQSPASHSTMVDMRRFEGDVPELTVHEQPVFEAVSRSAIQNR